MKPGFAVTVTVVLLLSATAARALTKLVFITPQNIQRGTFRLTAKAGKNHTVEFTIRRDVHGIDGPGRGAYLSNPDIDGKTIGRPVKLEEHDQTFTFRFSLPEDQVSRTQFTLWGNGAFGEGITYELKLGDFWKPGKAP